MNVNIPEGYMTLREAAQLIGIQHDTLKFYCKKGIVEGARKSYIQIKEQWIVPKTTVESLQFKIEEFKTYLYSVNEFAAELSVSAKQIYIQINNGEIPTSDLDFKMFGNKTLIDKRNPIIKNLLNLKEKIDKGTFLNLQDAAEFLNASFYEVNALRKHLDEKDEFKFFNYVYVNKEAIINTFNKRLVEDNYLSTSEAAEKLQKSPSTIASYCLNGSIPNVKKIRNQWFIPMDYIEKELERLNTEVLEDYMTPRELAKLFGVHFETVNTYCRNGTMEGAKKFQINNQEKWFVPKKTVEKIQVHIKDYKNKFLCTVNEFADDLGIGKKNIYKRISNGELPINNNLFNLFGFKTLIDKREPVIKNLLKQKVEIDNGTFLSQDDAAKLLNVPIHEIYTLRKGLDEKDEFQYFTGVYVKKQAILNVFEEKCLIENKFLSTVEAAEKLGRKTDTLSQHCLNGDIPNVEKFRGQWYIPKEYIEQQLDLHQNYKTIDEFAEQIAVSKNAVYNRISAGLLPHFSLIDNVWRIKVNDIPKYEEDFTIFARKIPERKVVDHSKETLIKELNERISNVKKTQLTEFTKLYLEWCEGKILNSGAHYNSLKGYVGDFVHIYNKIISLYSIDFGKETPNFTKEVLENTKAHPRLHSPFTEFLNYAYGLYDIEPQKEVNVSRIDKIDDEDKEIYTPEIYQGFNMYAREINKHLVTSCRSPYYANMWVYVLLHLTDVWRHSDIVEKIPNIDLKPIGVEKHNWFKKNKLSLEQCQKVIDDLYIKLRPEVTNKTHQYLTFLVEPTLIECVANALVISEIHRRKYQREALLFTMVSSSGETAKFGRSHLRFFEDKPELKIFRNRTMNNSTMTYLHYSIIEEDADNADVALAINKQTRSHKNESTTRIYVSVMNKDGSVNRVSLNIFRRGNFGWLYNYMILQAIEGKDAVQTMEERTRTIEGLREDVTPKELENWAKYINVQRLKRDSIIRQLSKMTKDELRELISKIFNQEMPAKTKPGQCMVHPSCKYPERMNCFGCEYFIPQYYVLIEAANEFKRLIKSMNEARYETTFVRDQKWLFSILAIFNEAQMFFEPELINGFLSRKEITTGIASLKTKVFLK